AAQVPQRHAGHRAALRRAGNLPHRWRRDQATRQRTLSRRDLRTQISKGETTSFGFNARSTAMAEQEKIPTRKITVKNMSKGHRFINEPGGKTHTLAPGQRV